MNELHLHLAVSHLPIVFPIVGVIVMITGLIIKSEAVKRTAYLIFILGALAAFAGIVTGEGAEHGMEEISAAAESFIEHHEDTAKLFLTLSAILGVISIIGVWASYKKKSFSGGWAIGTLIFALVVLFFAKNTGTTGGEIRHTEIRSGNSAANVNIDAVENQTSDSDNDND
ncbi:MAG: hypothetical protein H3C39_04150 [Flavobacteriia bacterium]|nr:hypothetical protein [Flavobacteriia bacterium]